MADNFLALEWDVTREEEGFVTVFRAHRDYVYRLACLLLSQPQDAEDVTQEVFLRLYKTLPSYQPERASLRTWLTRVVVNACHTHRRNAFQRLRACLPLHGPTEDDQTWPDLEVVDPSAWGAPEDQALHAELRQTLRTVLMRLRPEHRAVVVLHYYLDLSCPEIARTLACPEGTVYSRLHYARRVLQTHLERHGHGLEGVPK
jgi:RNA polymerase sigma-70 factor (ECF subfamily)